VLPILRTTLLGSVCLTLPLLAGFAVHEPARPHLSRVVAPARGPLIEANEHPEWKQFLVQAAFRRADELERLRDLPASPMIIEALIEPAVIKAEDVEATAAPDKADEPAAQIAALASERDPDVVEDITASIEEKPTGIMPIEIGASSSAELPLTEQEMLPQVRQPETLNDSQLTVPPAVNIRLAVSIDRLPESRPKIEAKPEPKIQRKRIARAKKKPPAKPAAQPTVPGLLSTIFGDRQSNPQ
jgi:hypothetical protein